MKKYNENRFLVWLMWIIPIACTGWFGICIWTMIQVLMCCKESDRREKMEKPIFERRPDLAELNKEENLSETDKWWREQGFLKTENGYIRERWLNGKW